MILCVCFVLRGYYTRQARVLHPAVLVLVLSRLLWRERGDVDKSTCTNSSLIDTYSILVPRPLGSLLKRLLRTRTISTFFRAVSNSPLELCFHTLSLCAPRTRSRSITSSLCSSHHLHPSKASLSQTELTVTRTPSFLRSYDQKACACVWYAEKINVHLQHFAPILLTSEIHWKSPRKGSKLHILPKRH